eukprot:TRINITY_DN2512_c0_g2_i4.p1 TRINITY_DN2512_c0_g2~~TRINITY_DN2512_c0_g2_i4.p1  ORF type:complete len:462 (+),score=155.43 TRINITY_DN2512_c0_g2_i4:176-1561(+)
MAHSAAASLLVLSEEDYEAGFSSTRTQEELLAQMRQMEGAGAELRDSGARAIMDDFEDAMHGTDMRGYEAHLLRSGQFFAGTGSGQFPTGSGTFGTGSGTFPTLSSGAFDTSLIEDLVAAPVPQTPSMFIAASYPQTPAAAPFQQPFHPQQQQPAGPASPIDMVTSAPLPPAKRQATQHAPHPPPHPNGHRQQQPKHEAAPPMQMNHFFSPQPYPQTPSAPQTPQPPTSPSSANFPASPYSDQSAAAVQLLQQIQALGRQQREQVDRLWRAQNKVMLNPQKDAYAELDAEQKRLKHTLDQELISINNLFDKVQLETIDLSRYYSLRLDLEIQLKQLELLMLELATLVQTSASPPCPAALVILKQPFPLVISKNKQLADEALQVQLLTASNVNLASISHVSAMVLCDAAQAKTGGKMVDLHNQALDPSTRIAKFPLKFLSGTKKASVCIKFGMQVCFVCALT